MIIIIDRFWDYNELTQDYLYDLYIYDLFHTLHETLTDHPLPCEAQEIYYIFSVVK